MKKTDDVRIGMAWYWSEPEPLSQQEKLKDAPNWWNIQGGAEKKMHRLLRRE